MRTHIPITEVEEMLDRLTTDLIAAATQARQDNLNRLELAFQKDPLWPSIRSGAMKVFSPERGLIAKIRTCINEELVAARKAVLLDSSDDAQLAFPFMN